MIDSLSRKMLPSAPLVDYVMRHHPYVCYSNGHGMQAVGVASVLPERLERVYWRARRSGRISVGSADDICYALGIHPTEIWGQDFYEEESAWPSR